MSHPESDSKTDKEYVVGLMLECDDCGEMKPDVHDTFCPYSSEILDEEIPITVCEDCYNERSYEI